MSVVQIPTVSVIQTYSVSNLLQNKTCITVLYFACHCSILLRHLTVLTATIGIEHGPQRVIVVAAVVPAPEEPNRKSLMFRLNNFVSDITSLKLFFDKAQRCLNSTIIVLMYTRSGSINVNMVANANQTKNY